MDHRKPYKQLLSNTFIIAFFVMAGRAIELPSYALVWVTALYSIGLLAYGLKKNKFSADALTTARWVIVASLCASLFQIEAVGMAQFGATLILASLFTVINFVSAKTSSDKALSAGLSYGFLITGVTLILQGVVGYSALTGAVLILFALMASMAVWSYGQSARISHDVSFDSIRGTIMGITLLLPMVGLAFMSTDGKAFTLGASAATFVYLMLYRVSKMAVCIWLSVIGWLLLPGLSSVYLLEGELSRVGVASLYALSAVVLILFRIYYASKEIAFRIPLEFGYLAAIFTWWLLLAIISPSFGALATLAAGLVIGLVRFVENNRDFYDASIMIVASAWLVSISNLKVSFLSLCVAILFSAFMYLRTKKWLALPAFVGGLFVAPILAANAYVASGQRFWLYRHCTCSPLACPSFFILDLSPGSERNVAAFSAIVYSGAAYVAALLNSDSKTTIYVSGAFFALALITIGYLEVYYGLVVVGYFVLMQVVLTLSGVLGLSDSVGPAALWLILGLKTYAWSIYLKSKRGAGLFMKLGLLAMFAAPLTRLGADEASIVMIASLAVAGIALVHFALRSRLQTVAELGVAALFGAIQWSLYEAGFKSATLVILIWSLFFALMSHWRRTISDEQNAASYELIALGLFTGSLVNYQLTESSTDYAILVGHAFLALVGVYLNKVLLVKWGVALGFFSLLLGIRESGFLVLGIIGLVIIFAAGYKLYLEDQKMRVKNSNGFILMLVVLLVVIIAVLALAYTRVSGS